MAEEPEFIRKVKAQLAQLEGRTPYAASTGRAGKPTGVVTVSDILDAERRLAEAQRELRDYSNGDDGMRETLDAAGIKDVVIDKYRLEQIDHLQAKVNARHLELRSVKQAWIGA